jgi:hypothetical protein
VTEPVIERPPGDFGGDCQEHTFRGNNYTEMFNHVLQQHTPDGSGGNTGLRTDVVWPLWQMNGTLE